jgi:uncharacterized membrane protein YdbT with pleckstrin-like domain
MTTHAPSPPPIEAAPLAAGEVLQLHLRPSPLFLVLSNLGLTSLSILLVAIILPSLVPAPVAEVLNTADFWLVIGALALFLWNVLDWLMRAYVLTDRRIMRVSGVLRRVAVDVPLRNIQSVTLLKSIRERLFGLGTLGVSTAGSAGVEFTWFMIGRPQERFGLVREAVERQRAPHMGGSGGLS